MGPIGPSSQVGKVKFANDFFCENANHVKNDAFLSCSNNFLTGKLDFSEK